MTTAKLGIRLMLPKNLPLYGNHIERIFLFQFVYMLSNSFALRKNIPRASRKASEKREENSTTMAKIIDESIKRQLSKRMDFFLKYFPVRVRNVGEDAVEARRLAVHEHRNDKEKSITKTQVIEFDADYFKGKDIYVFDDVVTTGTSYAMFANELETLGGNVLGGLFLGRTHYRYNR